MWKQKTSAQKKWPKIHLHHVLQIILHAGHLFLFLEALVDPKKWILSKVWLGWSKGNEQNWVEKKITTKKSSQPTKNQDSVCFLGFFLICFLRNRLSNSEVPGCRLVVDNEVSEYFLHLVSFTEFTESPGLIISVNQFHLQTLRVLAQCFDMLRPVHFGFRHNAVYAV